MHALFGFWRLTAACCILPLFAFVLVGSTSENQAQAQILRRLISKRNSHSLTTQYAPTQPCSNFVDNTRRSVFDFSSNSGQYPNRRGQIAGFQIPYAQGLLSNPLTLTTTGTGVTAPIPCQTLPTFPVSVNMVSGGLSRTTCQGQMVSPIFGFFRPIELPATQWFTTPALPSLGWTIHATPTIGSPPPECCPGGCCVKEIE